MTSPAATLVQNPRRVPSDADLSFGAGPDAAIAYDSSSTDLLVKTTDGGGVLTNRLSLGTGSDTPSIVFNEPGADVDLRVEGQGDPNLIFVDASTDRVGMGTASPGHRLDVVGASAAFRSASAFELHIEADTNDNGIDDDGTIVWALNGSDRFAIGVDDSDGDRFKVSIGGVLGATDVIAIDASALVVNEGGAALDTRVEGDTDANLLFVDASADRVGIGVATPGAKLDVSGDVHISNSGSLLIGDTSNFDVTQGLTVNQGANDDDALALKSNDVGHGGGSITVESDTYLSVRKASSASGGVALRAVGNDDSGLNTALALAAYGGTSSPTKSTSGVGLIDLYASEHDGADMAANVGADGNVVTVRARVANTDRTVMIVDEDGDLHVDGSSTLSTFDDYPDHEIARAIREVTAPDLMRGPRELVDRYGDMLEAADIVRLNRDTDGVPFINLKNLGLFSLDAIHQIGRKVFEEQEERIRALEERLEALPEGR